MVTDFGEQMHCQFLEILRILMDSFTMSGAHVSYIFGQNSLRSCMLSLPLKFHLKILI